MERYCRGRPLSGGWEKVYIAFSEANVVIPWGYPQI